MDEMTFGKLGFQFQQSLIKSIIEDPKYGERILEVLESRYFDNTSFKFIVTLIKEHKETYRLVPNYVQIKQMIATETASNPLAGRTHTDTICAIQELEDPVIGPTLVKDKALNFCKQQNLQKVMKSAQSIIDKGDFEAYDKIEEMIREGLQVGESDDGIIDIVEDIENSLDVDPRVPIPTGIGGLDDLLKGGIGRGELGMVLAPTGVGKSTILTKFANSAANTGHNVFHVFFEDTVQQIRQKHYTIWTGLNNDEQIETPEMKQQTLQRVREVSTGENFGGLKFAKMVNYGTTVGDIKRKLLKLQAEGYRTDLLVIDYIDCVVADRKGGYDEEWKGEGSVVRQLDAMASELNVAIWTASQGNRQSISSDIVNVDQMGGSIKKGQTAHIILSIAKSLEQKDTKKANMTLVKSRIGRDGVNFINCKFDNEYMDIDVTEQETLLGFQKRKEESGISRAAEVYKKSHGID